LSLPSTLQDFADRVGREAARRGWAPVVLPADAYAVAGLPDEGAAVFIVATAGQGDPPANARRFWRFLMRKSLPPTCLAGLGVAVFGLGDSGYPNYNTAAKKMGARLGALGAAHLLPPGFGDDQASAGPDGGLDAWLPGLWPALRAGVQRAPALDAAIHPVDGDCGGAGLGECRLTIEVVAEAEAGPLAPTLADALAAHAAFARLEANLAAGGQQPPASTSAPLGSSPGRPVTAAVAANDRVTAAAHWQHVAHLTLSLPPASAFAAAAPGDVMAVLPPQDPAAVVALCERVGVAPGATLRVRGAGAGAGARAGAGAASTPPSITVHAAALVAGVLALTSTPPRRTCVQALADAATDAKEKERLADLASPEGRDDWHRYAAAERRGLAAILSDFPTSAPSLAWLLAVGPRLQPRRFSLASDVGGAAGRGGTTAELAVAAVAWVSPARRRVRGLASAWLAALPPGASFPVWWEAGSLRAPPRDVPLILVGPGTGIAPLRAMLQRRAAEREDAQQAGSLPPPPCTLFFGCRSAGADFYFRADWEAARASGVLDPVTGLNVAFSRPEGGGGEEEAPRRQYVTDLIRSPPAAAALWAALSSAGAWVYVSGSARKMPGDVAAAIADVGVREGGMGEEEARAWVRGLQAGGRYFVEAWS